MNQVNGPENLEEKLRESEKSYRDLLETMQEGFAIHEVILDAKGRPADFRFLDANPAFERITGLKRSEIAGKLASELLPQTEQAWIEKFGMVTVTGEHLRFERFALDTGRWYEGYAFRPKPGHFAVTFLDITDHKRLETELQATQKTLLKSLRLYRMLSKINKSVTMGEDLKALYSSLCEVAVKDGGFRMAWLGLPDTDTGRLTPACSAGETGDYLDNLRIPFNDQDHPRGKGPSGSASVLGSISVCMDIAADPRMEPWREKAIAHGYASSAAVPLISAGKLVAVLNLYSSEKNWFSEDEVKLLSAVRSDCELAIDAISSEEKRAAAENALKRTTDHLMHVMESVPAVILQLRRRGTVLMPDWISGSFLEITGYSSEEMFAPDWFGSATFPEERDAVLRDAMQTFEKGTADHDFRLRRKDGKVIWIHAQLKAVPGTDELIGSWTDITHLKGTP